MNRKSYINLLFGILLTILFSTTGDMPRNSGSANNGNVQAKTTEIEKAFELPKTYFTTTVPTLSEKTYESYGETVSDAIDPQMRFSAVGVTWSEYVPKNTSAQISVRLLQKKGWSRWYELQRDIDQKDEKAEEFQREGQQSAFLPFNTATSYQYKVTLMGDGKVSPRLAHLAITAISGDERKSDIIANKRGVQATITQDMIGSMGLRIISRSEWGADEGLRVYRGDLPEPPLQKLDTEYMEKFSDELQIVKKITTNEKGEKLSWPIEYPQKISKIIVHHTASTADLDNPKLALRNIYYWHAIGRGWGDVGYNYIIDPSGNVYEGRAGGEGVIGAHAGRSNAGSIGISVMGNYETQDVTDKTLLSLMRLIAEKAKVHSIDPAAKSAFRGNITNNILGHRDVMMTSCPGKNLYDKLPLIAELAKASIKTTEEGPLFKKQKEKGLDFEDNTNALFMQLDPEKTEELTMMVRNTGSATWTPQTSLVVDMDPVLQEYIDVRLPPNRTTFPMENPKYIAPGDTATFRVALAGGFRSALKSIKISPMIDGKTKLAKWIRLNVQTTPAIFTYEVETPASIPAIMKTGRRFTAELALKNTGNITWHNHGVKTVRIGTDKPKDHKSIFGGSQRIATLKEGSVAPGEIGHFIIQGVVPSVANEYEEFISPVVENITWMTNNGVSLKTFAYEKQYDAAPINIGNIAMQPDSESQVTLTVRNMGGQIWTAQDGMPQLKKSDISRIKIKNISLKEDVILPGQVATFTVTLVSPKMFTQQKMKLNIFLKGKRISSKQLTIMIKKAKDEVSESPTSTVTPPTAQTSTSSQPSTSQIAPTSQSYAPPQPPQQSQQSPNGEPRIRVKISFDGNPIITSTDAFSLEEVGDTGNINKSFLPGEKVTVMAIQGSTSYKVESSDWSQIMRSQIRFTSPENGILTIANFTRPASWSAGANDNQFRDTIEVTRDGVINELGIDSYLKGLAETANGDPMEKKKAIIVAARTYAVFYTTAGKGKKFPGKPYDLDDDPAHSQKYLGYGYERRSPKSVESVDSTRGIVLKYLGNFVRTPYFSSDDGRTLSAKEAWGWDDAAYLPSVLDPYCEGKQRLGHGVGMSGCGSLGMANAGKTYTEILNYYYKGVSIEKIY